METLNVYWAFDDGIENGQNWNILAEEPESLYSSLSKNKNSIGGNHFFECPAFKNISLNTFVIKNPMLSSFHINGDSIIPTSNSYIESHVQRPPSIKNNPLFVYKLNYFFFPEEPTTLSLTSPFFHRAPHMQKASLCPGSFDAGSWFRMLNFEFNMWNDDDTITFEEDEPIAYIRFETNKRVRLQRFTLSPNLFRIHNTISSSSDWEPKVPLLKRYSRFKKSNMKEIVLKEIKENLV